jgi:hypothetical protein
MPTIINAHWIRKETNTEDALRVVLAPSTKVCSNMFDHPFNRAAILPDNDAESKSLQNPYQPPYFALFAGARPRAAAVAGAACAALRFLLSVQSRHQITMGLAMNTDE